MFNVVLFQPEIPPNTGNIIRLCANSGSHLHLVRPLGFDISEKAVRRAGMDYALLASVRVWDSFDECLAAVSPVRWFAISTKGAVRYDSVCFVRGDTFVFGPETRGLPLHIIEACSVSNRLRIPMLPDNRSLNLSNAAAVVVYEAWRQQDFAHA